MVRGSCYLIGIPLNLGRVKDFCLCFSFHSLNSDAPKEEFLFKIDSLHIFEIRQYFSGNVLKKTLSAILLITIFLGPCSYAANMHAQHHSASESSASLLVDHEHHEHSDTNDHSGLGHALTDCGLTTCVPTFMGTSLIPVSFAKEISRTRPWFAGDLAMPGLHLESDPPVPRSGFSKT